MKYFKDMLSNLSSAQQEKSMPPQIGVEEQKYVIHHKGQPITEPKTFKQITQDHGNVKNIEKNPDLRVVPHKPKSTPKPPPLPKLTKPMGKNQDIKIPKKEFVKEHKRLIDVLESPSHKDDLEEAKEQRKELQQELEKGLKAKLATAALGASLLSTPVSTKKIQELKINKESKLHPDLLAISAIESNYGKNKKHKKVLTGVNIGHTAAGATGLMPITIKETIKKDKKLANRYPQTISMDHDKLTDFINKNPNIENEIANTYYNRLLKIFGSDKDRIAYAWRNGITAAKGKSDNEIKESNYVKAVKNIRKTENYFQNLKKSSNQGINIDSEEGFIAHLPTRDKEGEITSSLFVRPGGFLTSDPNKSHKFKSIKEAREHIQQNQHRYEGQFNVNDFMITKDHRPKNTTYVDASEYDNQPIKDKTGKEHNNYYKDNLTDKPLVNEIGEPILPKFQIPKIFETKKFEKLDYKNYFEVLKKGSRQKKMPVDPNKESQINAMIIDEWQNKQYTPTRGLIKPLTGNLRNRALHKLSGLTKVRRAKDGKREYLLYRGVSDSEKNSVLDGKSINYPENTHTSWSPHQGIAGRFANKGMGHVLGAWVHEDNIHHYPRMTGNVYERHKGSKIKSPNDYAGEDEIIVRHSKPHEGYATHSFSDKSNKLEFNANSPIENKIKPLLEKPKIAAKLAASEKYFENLKKSNEQNKPLKHYFSGKLKKIDGVTTTTMPQVTSPGQTGPSLNGNKLKEQPRGAKGDASPAGQISQSFQSNLGMSAVRGAAKRIMGAFGKNEELDKGAKGDWQKEGYVIKHYEMPHGIMVEAYNKDGDKVGYLEAAHSHADKTKLYPVQTQVDFDHQRKGIASAMYQIAENILKKPFRPGSQSKPAKALWAQKNRPFGKNKNK